MVCSSAATSVLAGELGEILAVNDFNSKACQVISREPLIERWGQ